MFLNEADGVVHPNYAFSNHKEWWETLDCNGMLKAVGSDEMKVDMPAADSDQAMYCKHYAMSGPTAGMTFPAEKQIADGSDVDMSIEKYFMKRYEVIPDGMTMMHEDMGLMPMTEYKYRVKAVHHETAGEWSNTAMASTDPTNTAPVVTNTIGMVEVEVGETSAKMDLNMYFNDPDGETLTYTAMSNDETVATYGIGDGEPFDHLETNELEITGKGVGETTITVTATDAAEESVSQDITVKVESDEALRVSSSDADDGTITIMWKPIEGATSYHAIAYDRGTGEFDIKVGLEGTTRETTFTGLTSGSSYAIGLIGAMADGSEELVLLTPPFTLQ